MAGDSSVALFLQRACKPYDSASLQLAMDDIKASRSSAFVAGLGNDRPGQCQKANGRMLGS